MREKRHRYTGHDAPCVRRSHRPTQVARAHPPGRRGDSRNRNGNLRDAGPRGSVQATAGLTLPGTPPQETPEQRPMTSLRPSEVPGCRSTAGISVLSAEGEGFEPSVDRKAANGFRARSVQPGKPGVGRSPKSGGTSGGTKTARCPCKHPCDSSWPALARVDLSRTPDIAQRLSQPRLLFGLGLTSGLEKRLRPAAS